MIPDLLLGDVEKHLLDGNEILLVAKGEQNTAYHLSEITVPIVASSLFLVIKVQSDKISPAYLAWYLNTSECQANLHKMSRGSAVRSLAKRDLQKLQVPVPSLEAQRAILNLYELQQKEQQILQRLLSATQQLAEAQLLQIAKHDTL
jgi:restriction endonuclease S subunit